MSEPLSPNHGNADALFAAHSRRFEANRYVYPVLSRRSGGISIGVNLNPDKVCNFDCIYCQVNRSGPLQQRSVQKQTVELPLLATELERMVELAVSDRLYAHPNFHQTPVQLRQLRDIALSGDAEPTTFAGFADVVALCADVRTRWQLDDVKLVLITNATMFHRDNVRRGLEILDANNGEIWAKLDAGTASYYGKVARSAVRFERVLQNLTEAAQKRPIVIQSLFMRIHGQPPTDEEQEAFCRRLNDILTSGGHIKLVQVHTIARAPAESYVEPLSRQEVDQLAEMVTARTGLSVVPSYGLGAE